MGMLGRMQCMEWAAFGRLNSTNQLAEDELSNIVQWPVSLDEEAIEKSKSYDVPDFSTEPDPMKSKS